MTGQRISIYRVISSVARNLGLNDPNRYMDSFIEWAFEAEVKIGTMKTFVHTERYYGDLTAATGTITFAAVATAGDTITINDTVLTYVTSGATGTQVNIGASATDSAANAVTVLNATSAAVIAQATYSSSAGILTITHDTAGHDGNKFPIAASVATCDNATLTGGLDRVVNKQLTLPNDFFKLIDVRDSGANYYEPMSATFKNNVDRSYRFYINGNKMNFSNDPGTIYITYLGLDLDSTTGFPTIAANHEDAISAYLMWKQKTIDYINGKIPQYIYRDLEQRWYWLCGQARGNDNMPNEQELEQMNRIYMSLVPLITWDGRKQL